MHRCPPGPYFTASTAARASSAVLTWGTCTPHAPRSRNGAMISALFPTGRTIGAMPLSSAATMQASAVSTVMEPCSLSSRIQSNPRWPSISTTGGEGKVHVTLAPAWFDPGEVSAGTLTPFWVLYAMHDALVKPMPGNLMTPSLAESWTASADQRIYDFKLREGLRFHNGDPFTADDVKFSFQRSKAGKALKDRVREIEVVGPARVRFHLHEPFPDFMAYYGTVLTGAGWIVPRKYVERVGDEGFKKHPVGLGPYKFVSHTPGVELVLEAFEGYWRKMPSVKRLVMKTVPDPTTRAAMLKNGEVDIAYMLDAPSALELKRDPNFRLGFSEAIGVD